MERVGPERRAAAASPASRWPIVGGSRLVRCEMRAGGGVGAGTLGVDLRLGLLDDAHYLGLSHVVYGLRHRGGDGWKFAGKGTVSCWRQFGLRLGDDTSRKRRQMGLQRRGGMLGE